MATRGQLRPATKRRTGVVRKLGVSTGDAVAVVHSVRAGFPFGALAKLQKATDLPWGELSRLVGIPQRTMTRRQSQGRLEPDESDRVLRASRIFDQAVELFDGQVDAARKWLRAPLSHLGGESPLEFASTEVGAREVERLIGRLEHGVFA